MLLTDRFILLLALAVFSAFCQNAEPNRRFHRLANSSVSRIVSNSYAPADHFWNNPPEGGKESLDPQHGNEKQQQHGKLILESAAQSNESTSTSRQRQRQRPSSKKSGRQSGTRRQQQQQWRERLRENLVNVGGRGRLKKLPPQHEALASTAFGGLGKKTRSRTTAATGGGKFREERRRNNRRRRNRKRTKKRPRSHLQTIDRRLEDTNPIGILVKVLKEQLQANLDDNPLNLSSTRRFVELNEAAKVLEPEPANLTASYLSTASDGTVERQFSRQVEREFAKSGGLQEEQQPSNEDSGEAEPKFDERYQHSSEPKAPFDPQRMLGYSRTDEDLPILDLENEVLQRTIDDYQAYMSSKSADGYESSDRVEQLSGDLSCVNGTFLPAPLVRHALIKYVKSSRPGQEYLEADYECESGYALVSSSNNGSGARLLCHNRQWIGRLPVCIARSNDEDKKRSSCAELACDHLCRIVDDRPECSCREGFRREGASCIEVNGSQQQLGTFQQQQQQHQQQQQQPTTTTTTTPEPCSHDNAGCSHTCLASMGRVFCLCPDGFMLEDDWKTCQDVNECAVPDLQAEVCRYGCINTPGSYRCAPAPTDSSLHRQIDAAAAAAAAAASRLASSECQPGYQLNPQSKSCIDYDECATNNGGCSEICENTEGSFFCACEGDERILSADRRSCVVAEQRFEKMDREAAAVAALRQRFRAGVSCSALNPVGRGYLMCSDDVDDGVVDDGDDDDEEADEEQQEDEHEQEDEHKPEQEPEQKQRIRPGTKCHLKCPHGYELHGEYELTCRADGTWDGPKHGECLRYSKPRLDCPKDVVAELPPGRDEAFVTYEQPSTDLDWFRYVRSKPSWGTRLEANLKLGQHEIVFYARHPVSKKQASCTLRISVQEGQAPKVQNCPSDIQVTGKNGSAISWTEPIFSDNVKVSRLTSSQSPGQTFSLGGHKVEYEAADEAGWTTKCIFTVVLRPAVD